MIKGILFDKDGTVIELHQTIHLIYTWIFQKFAAEMNVPEQLIIQLKKVLGFLPEQLQTNSLLQYSTNDQIVETMITVARQYSDSSDLPDIFDSQRLHAFLDYYSTCEEAPYVALPKVNTTLRYLNEKEYKLGIATADTRTATIFSLRRANILQYFEYLGTSENTFPKPDPSMAKMFCQQYSISPDSLLMVGDSENDMLFARNSGAHFVGLQTPYNDIAPFQQMGYPVISQIDQIIDLFQL
jgi:phosphoglycolate phosphatase